MLGLGARCFDLHLHLALKAQKYIRWSPENLNPKPTTSTHQAPLRTTTAGYYDLRLDYTRRSLSAAAAPIPQSGACSTCEKGSCDQLLHQTLTQHPCHLIHRYTAQRPLKARFAHTVLVERTFPFHAGKGCGVRRRHKSADQADGYCKRVSFFLLIKARFTHTA